MKQIKMMHKANKENYIVPAFNFANFEILKGIIEACKETRSPVILQISESAMNYFTDEVLKGIIAEVRKIKLPISFHLDHGKSLDIVKRAIKIGVDSVMIDGSHLSFEQNVKLTKKVVTYAHLKHVSVEGELGVLTENNIISNKNKYTNPEQAKQFVELTGVDSLAVSIGTSHGVYKYVGEPKIRYDILRKIEKEIPKTPIVLHGASLVEKQYVDTINNFGGKIEKSIGNENLLKNAYKTNIAKINMDTYFRLVYTAAIREYMSTNPSKFCPRTFGEAGVKAVKECAIYRINKICRSNNKV